MMCYEFLENQERRQIFLQCLGLSSYTEYKQSELYTCYLFLKVAYIIIKRNLRLYLLHFLAEHCFSIFYVI